jgi:hypothetical protein
MSANEIADEETPLLQPDHDGKKRPTPLPWFQFSITLLLQLAEPMTSQVIYPFAPQVSFVRALLAPQLIECRTFA